MLCVLPVLLNMRVNAGLGLMVVGIARMLHLCLLPNSGGTMKEVVIGRRRSFPFVLVLLVDSNSRPAWQDMSKRCVSVVLAVINN